MSRPVDAIKHQAKTVTVGTSRISEKVEGILFDALFAHESSYRPVDQPQCHWS
jgi:glucosamine--fructose-6-phosphate aminotransferase (isomerizing)